MNKTSLELDVIVQNIANMQRHLLRYQRKVNDYEAKLKSAVKIANQIKHILNLPTNENEFEPIKNDEAK